jgi:phytoene desaturase
MESNMEKKKVIIIGAGIGGLGLACLLGKKGYDVTVLEKNESIGGRARIFTDSGFTFDMGPSWYMMPDVFEHFFEILGEKVSDHYTLSKLGPSYQITLKSDGKSYQFFADIEKNAALFESLEAGAGQKLRDFLEETKSQYEIAKNEFMYKNYDSIFDFVNRRVMELGVKLPIFKKQKAIIEKKFKNELIRKALQYQTVLLGTAPGDTPGIYTLMNYVDLVLGEWYPSGGIRAVPSSLLAMAKKYGVNVRTNVPVQKIIVENDQAKGVHLENGETLLADMVVSNADVHHTDTVLLPVEHRTKSDKYWNSRVMAPSAFILYLGVKGKLPQMEHHNLLFTKNWDESFGQIFNKPAWPHDPSMYICMPSKTDSLIAPADHENLFVLVPIASGLDYTDEFADTYEAKVLNEIASYYNIPDLKERIVVKHRYSVKDFTKDYNAFKGTALGIAHTLSQTAIFRPNNVHPKIRNMFYVGAGTNPGIGMPICLISAELAYKRIENITHPHPIEKI